MGREGGGGGGGGGGEGGFNLMPQFWKKIVWRRPLSPGTRPHKCRTQNYDCLSLEWSGHSRTSRTGVIGNLASPVHGTPAQNK